ncbi:hypothetical protein [Pseudomonas putida]|uniref:hypothetical protein n=1 Tax=Pseudomonas putida TaxID=303 RepID=UPI00276437C0|nr:hypothetical protein [Pseudomonas putida]MDP9524256.1 hypothetical protein [Pseudomonas putida]
MKKRFVVMIDSSTDEQNNEFLKWVKKEKVGWWHWINNSWLISNRSGHLSAGTIRDKITEIFPGENTLVIELSEGEGTWSGYGPTKEGNDMFRWIKENWNQQEK